MALGQVRQVNLEDILIAGRTIFGESRGEVYEGQRAVAHVILNRARKEGGISQACLRPKQFSCWNVGDATRNRMISVTTDDPKFRTAIRAFLEAVDEADFTLGSTHYHVATISPYWAKGHIPCLVIGNHAFYNDVK
jgi:N-acetylmuramoyl-L-alanine amidase